MKVKILTAHGYLSFQPDGRLEYRQVASVWETIDIQGLDVLLSGGGPNGQPSPTPTPTDDPLLDCSPSLRGLDLVRCLHSKIQPAGSVEKAFEVTKRVAWACRDIGAGLLLKPSGDNIVTWLGQSFAAARICWPDGSIVKVLTDVPTTNGPSWQSEGFVELDRYVLARDPRS